MRSLVWSLFAGALALSACGTSVGRPCVNPTGEDIRGTQITQGALECPSRLCLLQPSVNACSGADVSEADSGTKGRATCTEECSGDGDCGSETNQYCKSGFACAVAREVGYFCCRRVCVCKDDLCRGVNVDDAGKVIFPASCNPKNYQPGDVPQCPNVKVGS